MNDELRKVSFKIGDADLERIGFTREFRNVLCRELPKFFPTPALGLGGETIVLNLVRASKSNLHWTFQDTPKTKYFLKMAFGKGRLNRSRIQSHERAQLRSLLTGNIFGDVRVFCFRWGWIVLEALQFAEDRLTLRSWFERRFQTMVTTLGSFKRVGQNIAHKLNEVHTFKPTKVTVGGKQSKLFKSLRARRRIYRLALKDIEDRINIYLPIKNDNPFLSKEREFDLRIAMGRFSLGWKGESDRLCVVHGDPHGENVMLVENDSTDVVFIDFSPRVQLGEPRWDDGRFVADLLQLYLETKSGCVKALIDSFIDESEHLSGDKLYRQGLVWGIFSMTLLKFYTKGRPILNPEVAKAYLDNSLRIIEQGYFSWPS